MTTTLTIILAAPAVALGVLSTILLRRLPLPAFQLSDEDRELCRAVYERGEGEEWACPVALRVGACLRVPCKRLVRERLSAASGGQSNVGAADAA